MTNCYFENGIFLSYQPRMRTSRRTLAPAALLSLATSSKRQSKSWALSAALEIWTMSIPFLTSTERVRRATVSPITSGHSSTIRVSKTGCSKPDSRKKAMRASPMVTVQPRIKKRPTPSLPTKGGGRLVSCVLSKKYILHFYWQ